MLSGILISIIIAIIEHFTKVCNKNDNSEVQLRKSHPDHGTKFLEDFKKQASNLQLEQLQEILKCTQDQLQILIGKRPEKYIVKKKIFSNRQTMIDDEDDDDGKLENSLLYSSKSIENFLKVNFSHQLW